MKILLVTAGYSIFYAKGQLNSFLAYLTEKNLLKKGIKSKFQMQQKILGMWIVSRKNIMG